jgi:hypothetical protein
MSEPRSPRSEPEIIPPDRTRNDSMRGRPGPWVSMHAHGTQRVYVGRVGPLGIVLLALLIGTLAALVFIILLGAFLIWIPVAILLFVAFIAGGIMRRYLRR